VFISYLSHNKGKNITITQAAKNLRLPYRFLGQIAINLKSGGIIESKEGKSGGYQLVKGWDKKVFMICLNQWGKIKRL